VYRSESLHAPTVARPDHRRHGGERPCPRPREAAHADEECLRAYYREQAAECLILAMLGRRRGFLE